MRPWLVLVLLALAPACKPTATPDAAAQDLRQEKAMSPSSFRAIKKLILERGDRETYCAKYNHNPHMAFAGFDAFLDPDTGQANINCDPARSDFNELVIRDWETKSIYFRAKLDPATDTLILEPATPAAFERYFAIMIAAR